MFGSAAQNLENEASNGLDQTRGFFRQARERASQAAQHVSRKIHQLYPQARSGANDLYQSASDFYPKARAEAHAFYPKLRAEANAQYAKLRAHQLYSQARGSLPDPHAVKNKLQGWYGTARDTSEEAIEGIAYKLHTLKSVSHKAAILYLGVKLFKARNTRLSEVRGAVSEHIETKPVESAVIALGIGYLLGRFFR